MALTASDLVTAARQGAFGKQGAQRTPDALLLQELSAQDMMLTQLAAQVAPDLLTTITGKVTFTDTGNTNGYTLQNAVHYRDFVHLDSDDDQYTKVTILQRQYRESHPRAPAGMLRKGASAAIFYPIDPLGKRWAGSENRRWFEPSDGHEMSYSYVPLPVPITSLSDDLKAPQTAREVIVASLELRILLSAPTPDEAAIQMALQRRNEAVQLYTMMLYKYANQSGGRPTVSDLTSEELLRMRTGR